MSETNIFREVDEELRSERMQNLWRQYGIYVIGAAVLIVLLVAGNEVWRWWQQNEAQRSSALFETALERIEDGEVAAAQDALNVTEAEAGGRYPDLARFREAALLAEQGNTEEAIAAYDALASTLDEVRLRELASVYAAYLLADTGDAGAVQQRVSGLLATGHPLSSVAHETVGLAHYQAGDAKAAQTEFQAILDDPQASTSITSRAQIFLDQLIAEGVNDPERPVIEEPAQEEAAPVTEGAASEEAPAAEGPAKDDAAAVEEPAADAAPAEDAAPAQEAAPAEDAAPVEEPVAADEAATATEDPAPAEETGATTEEPAAQ
jgi:hypothetical protein